MRSTPNSNPTPGVVNVEILSHTPDPRKRWGWRLICWTVQDNCSRIIDVRTIGVLVSAAKARDGEPVSPELLRALDGPVAAYVRKLV